MVFRLLSKRLRKENDLDLPLLEQTSRVQRMLIEAMSASKDPELSNLEIFETQVGLIFLLQQDVFHCHGVNLADLLGANADQLIGALESIEELGRRWEQTWSDRRDANDAVGTILGGLLTNACYFWWTGVRSHASPSSTVKSAVE